MRIFRHYQGIPDAVRGAVVAIGNFDGVHRGHRALLAHARALADERNGCLGVVAFEPHPQEFFHPGTERFRLTPFRTKARLLAEAGVDAMFALPFDAEMAKKSAQEFVIDVLVDGLAAGCVVVGSDFQFGKGRAGDVAVLSYMGEMEGFGVDVFRPVGLLDGGADKISSSTIRDALKQGRPEEAARLLGRWWTVESRVEHGDKRGRDLGFPTANMRLDDYLKPAFGIYAVRATVMENDEPTARYDGVASFGIRPMFETDVPLLETHLFDFSGDLYNKHLAAELIAYLRPEMKFESLDALKVQMTMDCDKARILLRQMPATV